MAWYPCCDISCDYCDPADSAPEELKVVFTGIANNDCTECTNYNDTFILRFDRYNTNSDCEWNYTGTDTICGETDQPEIFAVVKQYGGNYVWQVQLTVNSSNIYTFQWDSGGSTKFNCSTKRTLSPTLSAGTKCDTSGASCTVEAA